MNNIAELLSVISYYLMHTRGAGHTYAAIHGVKENEHAVLITHDAHFGRILKADHNLKNDPISLDGLEQKIRGLRRPIIFDHFALGILLREAVKEIVILRHELDELKLNETQGKN